MTKESKKQLIIPFGKYKGKPFDVLLQDQSYAQWLTGQDWFQQKHQNMYTLIIHNYHTEPIDTPEHNQMQIKFLNEIHAVKLAYLASDTKLFKFNNKHFKATAPKFFNDLKEKEVNLTEIFQKFNKANGKKLLIVTNVEFENKGLDVKYDVSYGYSGLPVSEGTYHRAPDVFKKFWGNEYVLKMRVELKPFIGDDFPAVLRQMKTNHATTLVIKEYTGAGASFEEFKRYFLSQGISVFSEDDTDQITLPEYDKFFEFNENLYV